MAVVAVTLGADRSDLLLSCDIFAGYADIGAMVRPKV